MEPSLKENEMVESGAWVDVVWSLTVLNKIDDKKLDSVLSPAFIERLSSKRSGRGN